MSMKYFTLSAVCMLIFCMLLALSGTTDLPGGHSGAVSHSGIAHPTHDRNSPGKGQALASVYRLAEDSEPQAEKDHRATIMVGAGRSRPLFLLGVVFIAGWVLLSFRLFSRSKG